MSALIWFAAALVAMLDAEARPLQTLPLDLPKPNKTYSKSLINVVTRPDDRGLLIRRCEIIPGSVATVGVVRGHCRR